MQNWKFRRISFWAILGLVMPLLSAHPHIFIEGVLAPKISLDGRYLQGIEVHWSFDQIYSSQMILDFDSNKNGKIDKEEGEQVYNQAFVHLKELYYFLNIQEQDGSKKNIDLGTAANFRASMENGKMIYQFYVPFFDVGTKSVALIDKKEYVIYLEDSEYFIAFDSRLKPGLSSRNANLSSKEFMVQNLQWGSYPIHAVSVKGL